MKRDIKKTKEQLTNEVADLFQNTSELGTLETERKRAEEALLDTELKYRIVADNTYDWEWWLSPAGEFIYTSPSCSRITGYNASEFIDNAELFRTIFHPADLPIWENHRCENSRGKRELSIEFRILHKDGSERWIEHICQPVFDDAGSFQGSRGSNRDITERKRTEDALRDSEEKYRAVFEQAIDSIALIDMETKEILDFNRQAHENLGYTRDELAKIKLTDIDPTIAEIESSENVDIYQLENTNQVFETKHRAKSGEMRDVRVSSTFVRLNEKLVSICIWHDITERKKAEESLRESEEFSTSLMNNSAVPILVVNDDTSLKYVNPAFEKLTGFKAKEVIGRKAPYPWWAKNAASGQRDELKRDVHHGVNDLEKLFIKKNGEHFWVAITSAPIKRDGVFRYSLENWLDITERKRAEENIKHLNSMLRSVRNIDQLITREKNRNKLLSGTCAILVESHNCDSAWVALLDESHKLVSHAEAGLGKDFSPVLEQLRKGELPDCTRKAMKQSAVVVTKDPYYMCPNCPLSCKYSGRGGLTARLEYEDNVYGILCASVPKNIISDKDTVELFKEVSIDAAFALREMELEAEHRLLEGEILRIAKLELVGTLAGGIAHDFNNLLTGILGNISLAKRHIKPEDKSFERLEEAEKASIRARDLTQQLSTFTRGGMPVKKLATIPELLKETASFALRGSNVGLEFSLPDDLWAAEVDEGQVSQVIHNIVINADEAMPSGGTLHISAGNVVIKRMEALPLPKGNYVRIDIKDEGIGMSSSQLARMFEPYYTTKQKGSGLGLATAYSIIKKHGGYITAESRQNVGTAFHIYLPASEKLTPKIEEKEEEKPLRGKGRVLAMDDEEMICDMLKEMLTLDGYQVELTMDGAEAIEKYAEAAKAGKPFDVVIMDLTIPGGVGGKEAVKKLLEVDPGAKVIASSGYTTDPIMSEYKKYGFSAVITKPYSISQMEETLRGIFKGKKKSSSSGGR